MLQATQATALACPSLRGDAFATDVLVVLAHTPKTRPSVWLYDRRGSELFEEVTGLGEYYPTRTETALLAQCSAARADLVGPEVVVVEFGSGSSRKTPLLLDALTTPRAYVPVDLAGDFFDDAVATLARRCPGIPILSVPAGFTGAFALPPQLQDIRPARVLAASPAPRRASLRRDKRWHFSRTWARCSGHAGACSSAPMHARTRPCCCPLMTTRAVL